MVQVHVARRFGVFCEFDDDFCAAINCKAADLFAREPARAGFRSVDDRLGTLRSTQVGGGSGSVVGAVSTRGVSLGPYERCVVHLLPLTSADVGARILL